MKEDKLYRELKQWVGGHWTRIENTVTAGIPDTAVAVAGHVWWIELKTLYRRDTIYLRPAQRIWLIREVRHCTMNGICYAVDDEPHFVMGTDVAKSGEFKLAGKGRLAYKINQWEDVSIKGWEQVTDLLTGY